MRLPITLFLMCASFSFANEQTAYLDLLKKYPNTLGPLGDASKGEIQIITDPLQMEKIEKSCATKVGIVAEDKYWIWLNDPVKFPSGKEGVYRRILWVKSLTGPSGVAVIPVLPNGKIVLNRNYRHATRSWEYELPRGGINPQESPEAAARREVKEETGMLLAGLDWLGEMAVDTGLTSTVAPVYLARVVKQETPMPEESEAIDSIDAFSLAEIKNGLKQGYLEVKTEKGKSEKIPLRESFLSFALLQAEIRGLIHE